MSPRDVALATLPPALWAITYVIAKPATAHFPPLLLVSMVYGLTAAMLVRRRWRTPILTLLACGTFGGGVQSALIYAGIARVPATMTILVVQSQVPFAVLAACEREAIVSYQLSTRCEDNIISEEFLRRVP